MRTSRLLRTVASAIGLVVSITASAAFADQVDVYSGGIETWPSDLQQLGQATLDEARSNADAVESPEPIAITADSSGLLGSYGNTSTQAGDDDAIAPAVPAGKMWTCDFRVHRPSKVGGYAQGRVTQDCEGTGISSQAITVCLSHTNANGNLVTDQCNPIGRSGGGKLIVLAYFLCNRTEGRTFYVTGSGRVSDPTGTYTAPPPYQQAGQLNCSN